MTTRLTQRHLLKGVQHLEIADSDLTIRRKSPFRPAVNVRIPLVVLDPEPLPGGGVVSFASRASGQVLVSLTVGKPDQRTFSDFVNELRSRVLNAAGGVPGQPADVPARVPDGNVHDAPPELDDDHDPIAVRIRQEVNPDELEQAIGMLRSYVTDARVAPFIEALENLKADPADEAGRIEVARLFRGPWNRPGGGVDLRSLPGFLLSDHPFAD
ncbi:MAG: hypothetical protein M5U09_02630 [Gammaproteobacteria bacterium]|nr:hypothetical protein [Gammaproteobacteria bacterium]